MENIAARRKLLAQAQLLVKTNDAETTFIACAALLDALSTLMSDWTGEVIRVSMAAEGKLGVLEIVKRPSAASVLN